MSRDRDLELALKLQAQFDEEAVQEIAENDSSTFTKSTENAPKFTPLGSGSSRANSRRNEPMSIVDEQWELLDPNPDMRAMFLEFNDKYFWGRLAGVEVRWSPRMTLCAGLCCYEGHGGLCSIRLSSPLLKLRPRKDLVETLLHEMIHAYLFVTANNKDHDGHGPEFCKHMNRLNQSTGTNITIYHNFHDEVDVYRQHWWRCDGPCQKRPPYYGMVRRAMNRPPSKRDPWWAEHQRTCGGSHTKVKEPEGYGAKKGTKRKKEDADMEGIENETKKRATDTGTTSSFPGKGFTIGGTSSAARLVPPKTATLDKFLKKVEGGKKFPGPPPPPPSPPSSSKSQDDDDDEEDGGSQGNRSKNARLKALAAIFDSDDSDDEDIVIVKLDTSLKKDPKKEPNGFCKDSDSKPGTSKSNSHLTKTSVPPTPRNLPPIGLSSNSKPTQGNKSGVVSKTKDNIASTSKGNTEDHRKKQDSIIDAFNRVRQRSGDFGTKNVTRVNAINPQHNDGSPLRNVSSATDATVSSVRENGRPPDTEMVACPVCQCKVEQSKINQHLDQCLS